MGAVGLTVIAREDGDKMRFRFMKGWIRVPRGKFLHRFGPAICQKPN